MPHVRVPDGPQDKGPRHSASRRPVGIIDPVDTRRVLSLGLQAAAHAPVPEPRFGVFRM